METRIRGTAYLFGDNIDTDQIYPGRYLELTDPGEIAAHLMEGAEDGFARRFAPGGILVGGKNFGCGSSREHAAITIQSAGAVLVIAESFARIFFRNCINLGLPLLVCPGVSARVRDGDELRIDLDGGTLEISRTGETLQGEALSGYVLDILRAGGIKPLLRRRVSRQSD